MKQQFEMGTLTCLVTGQCARMVELPGAVLVSGPRPRLCSCCCSQVLPPDYYKEFLRVPYAAVTAFTLGAYLFHPIMQGASFYLGW
jgi:hypothetical protein